MSPQNETVRFIAAVVAVVLVLALVWPMVAPRYSRLVAAGVNHHLDARRSPVEVWVDAHGNIQADREWQGRFGRRIREASPVGVRGSWEGLLLLLALFAVTPRLRWQRRLRLFALATLLLSVYYGIYVVDYFRSVFNPGTPGFSWFPFSEVWVPLCLWAALTFRHWFPQPQAEAVSTS